MSDLLALLKRIEASEYMCIECYAVLEDTGHNEGCELKAQIDRLEAEHASERNEGHA